MGAYDDILGDSKPTSGGAYDDILNQRKPKQNQSLIADIGTGLKRGVEQMPGMVTGLADIAAAPVSAATGIARPFSRGADWLGEKTGFQPAKWAEEASQEYSPEMQQSLRNVEEAKGFLPTLGAIAENPRAAANLVAESLPSTIAGGLLARGAMGAVAGAENLAAMKAAGDTAGLLKAGAIAGGIGEGTVSAGLQMAQTDYGVDPLKAAGTALAAGTITGAIGAGSGRLANSAIGKKLGLSDLETSIAAGTLGQSTGKAGALGYAKRVAAGAAQEGLLEEATQSANEQIWQNIANNKPWNEGVAEASAQGAVAGGIMGGGINAIPRLSRKDLETVPPPSNPDVVEVPTVTGETVPVDRTSGPLSAAVHAGANSGAIPTVASVDATADPFERLATLELLAEQRPLTPQESAEANALSVQLSSVDAENVAPDQAVADAGTDQSTSAGIQVSPVSQQGETDPVMTDKTDKQLENLSKPGHTNATRQAATAEIERRVTAPVQQIQQEQENGNASRVGNDGSQGTGTVAPGGAGYAPSSTGGGQSRLPAEPMGASSATQPMVNADAGDNALNSPTGEEQQRRSELANKANEGMATVQKSKGHIGFIAATENSPVVQELISRDDGKIGIADVGKAIDGATGNRFSSSLQNDTPENRARITQELGVHVAPQQEQPKPLPESSNQAVTPKRKQGPQNRDDLVGAILRATGGDGIAANMAQTITGDKAGSGNAKLRGLFTNKGTMDLDDVAELLRVQEGFDVRDGDHLSELIRNAAAGDTAVSMTRTEEDAAAKSAAERKSYYQKRAEELGLKKVGGRRTLDTVIADVEREEARLNEMEANAERESVQVADAVDSAIEADMTEADFMRWLSDDIANTYTDEEIQRAEQDQADRENARVEANAIADAEERAQSGSQQGNGNQPATPQGGRPESGTGAVEGFGLASPTKGNSADKNKFSDEVLNDIALEIQRTEAAKARAKEKGIRPGHKQWPEHNRISVASKHGIDPNGDFDSVFGAAVMAVAGKKLSLGSAEARESAFNVALTAAKSAAKNYSYLEKTSQIESPQPIKSKEFGLAAQTPEELRAKAEQERAAAAQAHKEEVKAIRAEQAAKNKAEKDRRAAQVLAEREAAKKAEVDKAAEDFALGQEAPAPVERKVTTEDARGQGDVFAQPEQKAEQPAPKEAAQPAPNEAEPFDSKAWNKARDERVKASKESGAKHLDSVTPSVETMRGREIYYVHNPQQRGVIRTVDNNGNVYVHWSDRYSADKESASETLENNKFWLRTSKNKPILRTVRDGKTYVMESSLGTSDLKDYVFGDAKSAEESLLTYRNNQADVSSDISKKPAQPVKATTEAKSVEPWQMTREEYLPSDAEISDEGNTRFPEEKLSGYGDPDKANITNVGGGYSVASAINRPDILLLLKDGGIVGVYSGEFGIKQSHRGYGAATRLIKEAMRRGVYYPDLSYSVGGAKVVEKAHKELISEALSEGKPVPANVLADYPDLKPAAVDAKKEAKSEPSASLVPEEPAVNHEDVGGEMVYNRRNRRAHALKWEDVENKEAALRVKEVVKAKVYPKPDYQALINEGMEPIIAHMVKQAYDSLSTKPVVRGAPTDENLKLYIDSMTHYMDGVMAWAKNPDSTRAFISAIAKRANVLHGMQGGAMTDLSKLVETPAGKTLLDAVYPGENRSRFGRGGEYQAAVSIIGGNKALGALQPSTDEAINAAIRDLVSEFKTKETDKGVALYSKSKDATQSAPITRTEAESHIKSILGDKLGKVLIDSGIVTFTNKGSEYQGATHKDSSIALNLDALNADNFAGVFAHEGFHSTIRTLVGEQTYMQMMKRLDGMRATGNAAQWFKDADAAIPSNTKAENRTEEIAAYSIEQYVNGAKQPNVIKRWVESLLSALRTAVIQRMPNGRLKTWAVNNIQPRDLANLAISGLKANAREVAATSYTQAGYAGARMSKAQEQTVRAVNPGSSEPVQYGEAGGEISIKHFNTFVNRLKEDQPIDNYEHKQRIADLVEEIEADWSSGSSDEYSHRYGPDQIYADLHKENDAEYFDGDGDLTDSGSRRYNELERELSTSIAKDEIGEPTRKTVSLNKAGDMAKVVHAYFEKIGLNPSAISGSGKSDSKYLSVEINGEQKTVRISDHPLPAEHQDRNGAADYEIALYDVGDDLRADGRTSSTGITEEESSVRAVDVINSILQEQSREAMAYSQAQGVQSTNGIPEERQGNRTIDRAELQAIRRAAARLERPEAGITFRVTEDGKAIATGPKGVRVPERYISFSNDNGLRFESRRLPVGSGTKAPAMPATYRADGALYFGEMASNERPIDRTRKTRFSKNTVSGTQAPTPAGDGSGADIRYSVASTVANQSQKAKSLFDSLTSPDSINTLIYNFQNKFIDLKNLQAHIKQIGGTLTDLNDAYLGEEMYHGKVMKKTGDFLETEIRPLLQQLLNNGIKKEDFENFLHARHAPEANKVLAERNPTQAMIDAGKQAAETSLKALRVQLQKAQTQGSATKSIEQAIENAQTEKAKWSGAQAFQGAESERLALSGMSDAEAAQVMAAIPAGKRNDMNAAAAKVDAIQAKTLAELEKYGLMDKASLDAWRKEYQHYIPLHRDEAHPDGASHPVGQGFSVRGDASKRRIGSNEKVTNILAHIAMQREAAITRGEKNSVSKRLYLLAAQNPDKDFWSIDRPPMLKTIDPRTGFVRSSVDPTYKNKPNVLMVRIAGKDAAIYFNKHNPEAVRLAGALKNLDGQELDVIERTIGRATRWFAAVNTQYNPIFGVINLLRDSQSGLLNLTSTALGDKKGAVAKGIPAALKAIYQVERGGTPSNPAMAALWKDFQETGGQTGYRDLFASPEDRGKALEKELKALERGPLSQRLHAMADWLSDYNTVMENGVRLSAYKVALDQGMSKDRAASLAKNLTVNFNRKGAKAPKLGAFYAFFNASVQGTERLAKTMAGPAGRKILMGGIALGVLQQVLGAMMMGGDDDEWDKIPDFVKERSLIFPIGNGKFVSIPMPLGFNVLPNIGRLFAEWAMGGNDKPTGAQIGKLMNVVLSSFNPVGGNNLVDTLSPTVSDPVVSLLRNKDWTGKPIYREDMSSLDPTPGFTRTKDSATPWAKGLSYVINMATGGTDFQPGALSPTPDQIDYVIGQLTGGVGRETGKLAQTLTAPFTGDELPVHKIPLAGRLIGSTSGVSGQSAKFYENLREINGIEREIKGLAASGGDVSGYLESEPRAELIRLANSSETRVKKLRDAQREMKKQGDIDAAREIDGMVNEVMKGLNVEARMASAR